MTIELTDHPEIQSALELKPDAKYLIVVKKSPPAEVRNFIDALNVAGIQGVVIVLTDPNDLKMFDVS